VQAKRIRVFLEQTAPLIDLYRERGLLIEIDGEGSVAEVTPLLRSAVEAALGRAAARP